MNCTGTRLIAFTLVLIGLAANNAAADCCPFCGMQGQTLTGEVTEASLVLYGTLANARLDPANDLGQGSTDLHIETIIKKHDIAAGKKVITLPRYLPAEGKNSKFLIFCGVFQDKIDPYRGISVKADSAIVKYLQGALTAKDKPIEDRLRFFFDYLDNTDIEVSNDAYKEFANADYKDYRNMAKKLPADRIVQWLKDPDTPAFKFGLYASMLGHCGTEKDADFLRKMLDGEKERLLSGTDGVLAGYAMLKPKEGWSYIRGILGDASKDFMMRYAALRSARFFWDYRSDLIGNKETVEAVKLLLDQSDIADLAIEDLRKWGQWHLCDQILGLYGQKSHDVPVVRRAILRFAINCQERQPKAAQFVAELRKKDPELVKDTEELLKLEIDTAPKTTTGK